MDVGIELTYTRGDDHRTGEPPPLSAQHRYNVSETKGTETPSRTWPTCGKQRAKANNLQALCNSLCPAARGARRASMLARPSIASPDTRAVTSSMPASQRIRNDELMKSGKLERTMRRRREGSGPEGERRDLDGPPPLPAPDVEPRAATTAAGQDRRLLHSGRRKDF